MNIELTDLDYLKKQRVHFAIPCLSNNIAVSTFNSFAKWVAIAEQFNIEWTVDTISNEELLPKARNILVSKFLESSRSTHLMLINHNVVWEPWHILALLSAKKHLIGGIFPNSNHSYKMTNEGDVCEVMSTDAGFMMVTKEAFFHLDTHSDIQPFNPSGDSELISLKTYFNPYINNGTYYSDWQGICMHWRDLGGKVWVHNKVEIYNDLQ